MIEGWQALRSLEGIYLLIINTRFGSWGWGGGRERRTYSYPKQDVLFAIQGQQGVGCCRVGRKLRIENLEFGGLRNKTEFHEMRDLVFQVYHCIISLAPCTMPDSLGVLNICWKKEWMSKWTSLTQILSLNEMEDNTSLLCVWSTHWFKCVSSLAFWKWTVFDINEFYIF